MVKNIERGSEAGGTGLSVMWRISRPNPQGNADRKGKRHQQLRLDPQPEGGISAPVIKRGSWGPQLVGDLIAELEKRWVVGIVDDVASSWANLCEEVAKTGGPVWGGKSSLPGRRCHHGHNSFVSILLRICRMLQGAMSYTEKLDKGDFRVYRRRPAICAIRSEEGPWSL